MPGSAAGEPPAATSLNTCQRGAVAHCLQTYGLVADGFTEAWRSRPRGGGASLDLSKLHPAAHAAGERRRACPGQRPSPAFAWRRILQFEIVNPRTHALAVARDR